MKSNYLSSLIWILVASFPFIEAWLLLKKRNRKSPKWLFYFIVLLAAAVSSITLAFGLWFISFIRNETGFNYLMPWICLVGAFAFHGGVLFSLLVVKDAYKRWYGPDPK